MEHAFETGPIVWKPTADLIAQSNIAKLMDRHRITSYDELMRRSTEDFEWFWNDVIQNELSIKFEKAYDRIVDLSRGNERPTWCPGGRMNIITNLLDRYENTPTDSRIAIRYESEEGTPRTLTYVQLRSEVNKVANALRELKLGKGDAIGVFMPMGPECVIAMLAIIKIGGIFLPLFSGYGAGAVVARLSDADAKALFTCDCFSRRGKNVDMLAVANEAIASCPTVKHVIVHRRGTTKNSGVGVSPARNRVSESNSADAPTPQDARAGRSRHFEEHSWQDIVDRQSADARTESTSAEDVQMLIYTSGTTGKPKGAVHTHCGFPIKAAQDMKHGLDLHEEETLWWVTDIGWMMGPWLVYGTLLLGATMMLYDGALDYPGNDRLWDLCAKHDVTALGISPTLIRALLKHGDDPVKKHDLSKLRKFASTGEPWNPPPWMWLFETVGEKKLPIINYSGGTEISGGILMGNVLSPMKPCAFSGPVIGMAADVVDENGRSVRNGVVGELIIRKPWIGMTRGFWKDDGDKRYHDAYWNRFPGVWTHGDFATVDNDNLWYIVGRSDDTIKVAGKRLGPAEVESILVGDEAVQEAAAIGIPDEVKGQALVCFCVLKNEGASDALKQRLSDRIVKEMGKPLKPKDILFVKELPKTRNAKVLRRVIRAAYLGTDVGDISSLENPGAVDEVRATQKS